jgi:hypothetical protein
MARKTGKKDADVITRLADSGENAIRTLVALPVRMLVGALDLVETQVHKAADRLREIDPLDERVVELERRVDSLEKRRTGRRQSSRKTAATRRAQTAVPVEPEPVDHRPGRHQDVPGSETAAGSGGA